jgi:hypothetical protein
MTGTASGAAWGNLDTTRGDTFKASNGVAKDLLEETRISNGYWTEFEGFTCGRHWQNDARNFGAWFVLRITRLL